MELRVANRETLDEIIAVAGRHFFSGSEPMARNNLGSFDPRETDFILVYSTKAPDPPIAAVTVRWNCGYPPFAAEGIPFIQNLEIRDNLRRQGHGRAVLEAVESYIGQRVRKVGICVALFDAFGPAQRLYAKCGYLPDGRGACHRFTPLRRGDQITLGDDHLLWLVKDLASGPAAAV